MAEEPSPTMRILPLLAVSAAFALLTACTTDNSGGASEVNRNRVGTDSPSTPIVDDRNHGSRQTENVN